MDDAVPAAGELLDAVAHLLGNVVGGLDAEALPDDHMQVDMDAVRAEVLDPQLVDADHALDGEREMLDVADVLLAGMPPHEHAEVLAEQADGVDGDDGGDDLGVTGDDDGDDNPETISSSSSDDANNFNLEDDEEDAEF